MTKAGRTGDRGSAELRPLKITPDFVRTADGSVLIELGGTRVLCSAQVVNGVPGWRRGSGEGWLTAEYSLLPSSTRERTPREAVRGRQDRLEDALGCAKLVLVSLDRSREALEGLQRESGEPYIGRMLTTLSELTQMMEVRFPAARSFVRAGLDGPHEAAGVAAARRGA